MMLATPGFSVRRYTSSLSLAACEVCVCVCVCVHVYHMLRF